MKKADLTDEEFARLLFSRDVAGQVEKIIWAATNQGSNAYAEVVDQITQWVDNPTRRSKLGNVRDQVHTWLFGKPRAVQHLVLSWLKPRPLNTEEMRTVLWDASDPRLKDALANWKEGDPTISIGRLHRTGRRSKKFRDFIDSL